MADATTILTFLAAESPRKGHQITQKVTVWRLLE